MPEFCHLHCHTQYSLLDGAARIKTLVARAQAMEMPAIAITDHGNLYGVPEFYFAAKDKGIQPIIGCEFYITQSGMQDRTDKKRYHQLLLAKNEEGYRNLIKLSSLSYTEGYYYKPRIDRETLKKHSAGLIATTCCLASEVQQTILRKGEAEARKVFEDYLAIFGEDYYIELQNHGIPEQQQVNEVLLKWAKEYNVKCIVTNDVHYVKQEDAEAHDVMLCLQTGREYNDPNRMRFENDQFYLKSADEMRKAFPDLSAKLLDEALDTTREIADKAKFEVPTGKLLMPHYPLPPAFNNDMNAFLRHLTFEKAKIRYPQMTQEIAERLDFELKTIEGMGFAGYFLIVQDFTTAARDLGVRVGPGRGSAAGSAVAYCLGITNIDPLPYNLLFERFLNPERVSMPDVDIDFDDRGRGKVIDYVVQKYGRENVCQIITFGTMGAKTAIRDVARVLNIPLAEADRIAKLIPEGAKENLETAREKVAEFDALYQSTDTNIRKLMHYSTVLEGSARHSGIHAAGVIIAPGDVSDYVPVAVAKSKGGAEEAVTTQFDGKWVETFGLLKMDFLGLKTLTIINDTLALIQKNHDVDIDIDAIPLDDKKTYELFQKGDTVSIFQFESTGMREWMRKLRPTSIDDLIAMNALYRPGPMDLIPNYIDRKHGREEVVYPHSLLEEVLKPTYGLPIYQEQVMQMAQVMGGYTLGGADLLRRAMGKKKVEEMQKQRAMFLSGAQKNDVPEKTANEVFDMMEKFAGYGFNKSHSAAYSVVAYQTAYLKAHYQPEFMAAVMTSEANDIKKLTIVLEEARHLGLNILPPNINTSDVLFTTEGNAVRFGLGAIKGVGTAAIESLIKERNKSGAFKSIYDLCARADLRLVNKKVLESLAKAGAFDVFEGRREQFVAGIEDAVRYAQQKQANEASGMMSLFGDVQDSVATAEPALPNIPVVPRGDSLREERELMGFYLSGHPLDDYRPALKAVSTATLGNAEHLENGRDYTFCGIVTTVQKRLSKNGKTLAFVGLEDLEGSVEIMFFSDSFDKFQHILQTDALLCITGKVETEGRLRVLGREVMTLEAAQDKYIRRINLNIRVNEVSETDIDALYQLCDEHRGKQCRLGFTVFHPDAPMPLNLRSRTMNLEVSPELLKGLNRILGSRNVILGRE